MRVRHAKAPYTTLCRSEPLELRSVDKEARTAEFVASTEIGVRSWFGLEWMRAAGVQLGRFQKNPIFLDTHERDSIGCVIGRCQVRLDAGARQVLAKVEYAKTTRAQEVWELVRDGFVRAVSVGYLPLEYRELDEGETDGEGDAQVVGPGVVITKWELLELSQCPLPADEDALLRSRFYGKEEPMGLKDATKDENGKPSIYAAASGAPGSPVPPALPEGARSAPPVGVVTPPAPSAAPAPAGQVIELDAERSARVAEARKREIHAIAPTNLREVADMLVLEGVDVATARQRLLEEQAKRSKPAGTPEPPQPGGKKAEPVASCTPDEIAHAFKS